LLLLLPYALDVAGAPLENIFILYINGHAEKDLLLNKGLLDISNVGAISDSGFSLCSLCFQPLLCIGRRLANNIKFDNWDGTIHH
jgi:hypothetical protein